MDARLKIEAALAAGPINGPWKCDNYGTVKVGRFSITSPSSGGSFSMNEAMNKAKANAAFIAACNPANIRELLATHTAEIAAREAEMARLLEAATAVLAHRAGDLPNRGWLIDNDASRGALHELAAALTQPTE